MNHKASLHLNGIWLLASFALLFLLSGHLIHQSQMRKTAAMDKSKAGVEKKSHGEFITWEMLGQTMLLGN